MWLRGIPPLFGMANKIRDGKTNSGTSTVNQGEYPGDGRYHRRRMCVVIRRRPIELVDIVG